MRDTQKRLRRWHERSGLSVAELSRKAGCSRPMLSAVLHGHRRPGLELAVRIERLTMGAVRAVDWIPVEEVAAA